MSKQSFAPRSPTGARVVAAPIRDRDWTAGEHEKPAQREKNKIARVADSHGNSAFARAASSVVPRATPETAKQRRRRIFAYNLRRLREARGWKQEELADRAGVGWREQVVHWESGKDYEPGADNLEKLCLALGVDEREFRTPIPDPEPVNA